MIYEVTDIIASLCWSCRYTLTNQPHW